MFLLPIGVLVFADVHGLNYDVADPDLRRISSQNQIERVISSLATFHSICTAFEQSQESSFEKMFPFLSTDQGKYDKNKAENNRFDDKTYPDGFII